LQTCVYYLPENGAILAYFGSLRKNFQVMGVIEVEQSGPVIIPFTIETLYWTKKRSLPRPVLDLFYPKGLSGGEMNWKVNSREWNNWRLSGWLGPFHSFVHARPWWKPPLLVRRKKKKSVGAPPSINWIKRTTTQKGEHLTKLSGELYSPSYAPTPSNNRIISEKKKLHFTLSDPPLYKNSHKKKEKTQNKKNTSRNSVCPAYVCQS